MACARFGERPFDLRIDPGRLASIPSLPYGPLQLEHRAADTIREALAKRGQGTEPAGLGSPTCRVVHSLHVIRSLRLENRCAGFRHAAMAPRVISERSTREKFVTSSHPIGLRGLQENFLSSLAGRSGCANHYCRPGKSPWMKAVRLQPRAHSGAAFVPNKVRNSTKVDVRFVCRSTFSCPPSVTVKLCQVAPVAIPALPTTISDPGTRP